jgi:hypothetical protein
MPNSGPSKLTSLEDFDSSQIRFAGQGICRTEALPNKSFLNKIFVGPETIFSRDELFFDSVFPNFTTRHRIFFI